MNFIQQRLLALQGWYNRQKQDQGAQRMGEQIQYMVPAGSTRRTAIKIANKTPEYAKRVHKFAIDGKKITDKMSRADMSPWIAYAKQYGKKFKIN